MSPSRTIAILAFIFSLPNVLSAAAGTSDLDFFWLPPIVPTAATPTGPFDATALGDLVIEVCELDPAGACVAGPPIARFTSTGRPASSRIKLHPTREFYTVNWLTGDRGGDRDREGGRDGDRTSDGRDDDRDDDRDGGRDGDRGSRGLRLDRYYRVRVLKAGTELGSIDIDVVRNARELALVDVSRYLGLVRGQHLAIRFRLQHPTARTRVKVNEVESSGDVPGDWVELYNTAAVPVSLADYVIKDSDDTHVYTLPFDAMIPAQGYYVVEESALGFGLGANDAVRFFTPDGAIIVDSYIWAAHALTSYGRCPADGTGVFQTNTTVTKGAANDCSVVIRINEVESNGGTPDEDWVELYNAGPGPANLAGFRLRDNDNAHNFALLPVVVPAGGFLVLEQANFGFALDAADSVRLFRPDGSVADFHTWTSHATTTYGRCPNGTGVFATTLGPTKGTANNCFVPVTSVHINEVESNGSATDWVELINTGVSPVDLSGWRILDNDDTHIAYILPTGSIIAPGGYLVVNEPPSLGFVLGAPDSVRLYDPFGALYESYSWTSHATTSYGRCPNGTGAFTTTTSLTMGAPNDCGNPVKINEVESSDGTPGDWVELYNPGGAAVDLSGFLFRDNDDTHTYTIPSGTMIPAGGYYLLEEGAFGFGLGGADSARLFNLGGVLIDSYSWTVVAATTYGRCPNGTGAFATTAISTKGTANVCQGDPLPWPGDAAVQTADGLNVFGGNLSGLVYEGSGGPTPGVLWAVRNGPGALFRLVWDGSIWTPDPNNAWGAGKALHYPDGTGNPDAEGVTFAGPGTASGIYVSTERNNDANSISRNTILRFDPTSAGTSLTATHEWNLTADLPVVGANLGTEGITWIPDTFLVSRGFADASKSPYYAYNPADYPNHGTGLFFVGVEANGMIYAYALDHSGGGGFTRVATISSGLTGVMDLQFDREMDDLWALCDDTCLGQSAVLRIEAAGTFTVKQLFARPGGMPNLNNEGFTFAPLIECEVNRRPAFWADDSETGGHAIRSGTLTCTAF